MPDRSPGWNTWHYSVLWLIAIISLGFNILLVAGFIIFRLEARQQIVEVSRTLDTLQLDSMEVPIHIDQQLPISLTIPFSDTFHVPISNTVAISTAVLFEDVIEVPIRETIAVNTTVNVPITLVGQTLSVPFPIATNIPISLTVMVPISREVPVQTDIPVQFEVDVPVQSMVPVQSTIPVVMDFPVDIPLEQLGLGVVIDQLKEVLNVLSNILGADTTTATLLTILTLIILAVLLLSRNRILRAMGRVVRRPERDTPIAYLAILSGDERAGQVIGIYGDTPIGRSRDYAQLLFQREQAGSTLGRLHSTILERGDHFTLRDEDSVSGTYLNSQRLDPLQERRLMDGDIIELGSAEHGGVKLRFQEHPNAPRNTQTVATNAPQPLEITQELPRVEK